MNRYCPECGSLMEPQPHGAEGEVPFCPTCGKFRHPLYNVAVSMIVINRISGKILLIRQYGKPRNILVAGYVNRGESAEDAVRREIKEETGMTVESLHFNRTRFFEPSNTLMINFTAFVRDDSELHPNEEIDAYGWYTPEEAKAAIAPGSLASAFLHAYLEEV